MICTPVNLLIFSLFFVGCLSVESSDAGLDIFDYLTKYKYSWEKHYVTTEDGYILGLQRITSGQNDAYKNDENKPPVLMVHGLESSSMDYVNMGPGKSLALMLADEGYDVWLGNVRGNTWSRNHTTLNVTQEEFYQFSFHQMGQYDLPAKIDYILQTTNFKKVSYIGHSQGTTSFFIMGSIHPEYNDKIQIMAALAPVVYMKNIGHPIIQFVSNPVLSLGGGFLLSLFKYYLVIPHYDAFTSLGQFCAPESQYASFCKELYYIIGGKNEAEYVPEMFPVLLSNAPAGASYRQLFHYLQEIRSGSFQAFDYGLTINREVYGQKTPPVYTTSKITAPIAIYYSKGDLFTNTVDVEQLVKELPNVVRNYLINQDEFTHLDYLWARNIDTLLNNDVVYVMNKYNGKVTPTTTTEPTETTTRDPSETTISEPNEPSTASPPEASTAPPPDASTAPPPEASTAPPPEATTKAAAADLLASYVTILLITCITILL